jgi:hypothetical protein
VTASVDLESTLAEVKVAEEMMVLPVGGIGDKAKRVGDKEVEELAGWFRDVLSAREYSPLACKAESLFLIRLPFLTQPRAGHYRLPRQRLAPFQTQQLELRHRLPSKPTPYPLRRRLIPRCPNSPSRSEKRPRLKRHWLLVLRNQPRTWWWSGQRGKPGLVRCDRRRLRPLVCKRFQAQHRLIWVV